MDQYGIDLRAKQISTDTQVWRMFAGDSYEFFNDFLSVQGVFLDVPGLTLPQHVVTDPTAQMRERLALSHATARWIEDQKSFTESSASNLTPPPRPSLQLTTYAAARHVRNYGRLLGSINTLFDVVKKGDLVIIPNKIPTREVIIGEFLDDPTVRREVSPAKFLFDTKTAYRRVRWFPPVEELRVPREITDNLRIPVAISLIPRHYYGAVFELSFGNFLRPEDYFAKISVRGSDFSAQDTIDFGAIAKLAAFLSANLDEAELTQKLPDYLDVLLSKEFQPTLSLNINSPGYGGFRAAKLSPIIFAALFALFSSVDANANPRTLQVSVTNSVPASDRCETDADKPVMTQIEMAVNQTLAVVGVPEFKKLCERAQRLANGPMLHVETRARHVK